MLFKVKVRAGLDTETFVSGIQSLKCAHSCMYVRARVCTHTLFDF